MNRSKNALDRGPVSSEALEQLFRQARTLRTWLPKSVPELMLREIYDLARLGPTSANCLPGRFVFVVTPEGKERLRPALAPGNVDKTMTAPATAIITYDTEFYEKMPEPWPARFRGNSELIRETAFRNGTLQGAYLIVAARALGLDCGPMSGFDAAKINQEFFPDGKWKANFLCNLGYGDRSTLRPREPRLDFEVACRIL